MKLTVKKHKLIEALQVINPITVKSSNIPVLSNFVLSTLDDAEAGPGLVEYSATSYEISIRGTIPVEIEEAGSVCISAGNMLDVCRNYLVDDIRLQSDQQSWVTVEGGSSQLRLPSMDIGLYPNVDMSAHGNCFDIGAQDLKQAINLTVFATQTNEARRNLMGVHLKTLHGNRSCWTATDGHRLSQVNKNVTALNVDEGQEIIIPRKFLDEVSKALDSSEAVVSLSFDDRNLKLRFESLEMSTRLIEGRYPNVDPIIPLENPKHVLIDRERLRRSLEIVSVISTDKVKPVKFSMTPGKMRLESEHSEIGYVADEIEVEYDGDPFTIGFNAVYMMDVLKRAVHEETIRLELKGDLNPGLIRLVEDESFLAVVMPLRIEW